MTVERVEGVGDDTFFRELVEHHISGQLKVAPEHISDAVLRRMGKPENAIRSVLPALVSASQTSS